MHANFGFGALVPASGIRPIDNSALFTGTMVKDEQPVEAYLGEKVVRRAARMEALSA
jgi:hypothetical protein